MGKKGAGKKEPKQRGAHIAQRQEEQDQINRIVFIGAAVFAGIAMLILPYMLFFSDAGVTYLTVDNMDELKTVFYGGDPWVVVCQQKDGLMKETVTNALNPLAKEGVKVGVVQCSSMLPSNKTISERFKLTKTKPITAFLCVNGKKPVQIPRNAVQNAELLTAFVKPRAGLQVGKIERSSGLYQRCYNQKHCVLFVKYGELSSAEGKTIQKLAAANRNVAINVINSQTSKFSLSKKLPADDEAPLMVMVKKGGIDDPKDSVAVKLHKGGFDQGELAAAVTAMQSEVAETETGERGDGFKVLNKRPTVKPRNARAKATAARSKKKKPRAEKPPRKPKKARDHPDNAKGKPAALDDHDDDDEDEPAVAGEGMTSSAERERRRKLDEEMSSMFEEADGDEEEDEDDGFDEDAYEEIEAEEDEEEM